MRFALNPNVTQSVGFYNQKGTPMTLNINTKLALTLGVLLSTLTTTGFAANPLQGNPFIPNSSLYLQTEDDDHGDQDEPDQDCEGDKGDQDGGGKGEQDDDKGDQDYPDQNNACYKPHTMRVDCRYRAETNGLTENGGGPKFCYASAIYKPQGTGVSATYTNVVLGVGCDSQTIFNNSAWVHTETVSERIAPKTAAFPAVEIFPQGALAATGTYESTLDVRAGRLNGVCYVHPIE